MAEFDFTMDPEKAAKAVKEQQEQLDKGITNLKKYEKNLTEYDRIALAVAKKRLKIARDQKTIEMMEATERGHTRVGDSYGRGLMRPRGGLIRRPNFDPGASIPEYRPKHELSVGGGGPGSALSVPEDTGKKYAYFKTNEGGGSFPGAGGGLQGPSPFAWMKPEAGQGGQLFLAGAAAFSAAVAKFGSAVVAANATRSQNLDEVGNIKARVGRAAKTLGLDEQALMISVTNSGNPDAAVRALDQWELNKRKTGKAPSAQGIQTLLSAGSRGAIDWENVGAAGLDGSWAQFRNAPGYQGDGKTYNDLVRGRGAANYDSAAVTWDTDLFKAKRAMYSDAEWKQVQANNPFLSQFTTQGMREALDFSGATTWSNRQQMLDAYGNLPTGVHLQGTPSPSMQSPVQQLGDLTGGGRGVQSVTIQNIEAIRPRSQPDIRSGNRTGE
jgi:hypothetical protein